MKVSFLKQGFLLIVLATGAIACRKNDDNSNPAGKGGNATVITTLAHHQITKNIINGKVYIKYNTQDAPGNGIYDDSAICNIVNTVPTASFDSLKAGNYYLYGTGYDTSIARAVNGGISYSIPDNSTTTYTIQVPVTEGD
ncbi:hypothetical protein [Taibaiella soli]|uniref:Uncharacterized protein n=1 Tax=Taibaiella soli TaxID=1649169 RepID=A0A2W2BBE9_9BACT|nr:hypothetical protein [Taibaiella soli]PZF73217.1 hypothetical protein DN068_10125 [Taibaiella soli]